jgi:hypothetical protein
VNSDWVKCVANGEAIRALYEGASVPDLRSTEVTAIQWNNDGPSAVLSMVLNPYPARPPEKWVRQQFNTLVMHLRVAGLEGARLERWSTENRVDLQIRKNEKGLIEIRGESASCSLWMEAHGLRIDQFAPYCRERP